MLGEEIPDEEMTAFAAVRKETLNMIQIMMINELYTRTFKGSSSFMPSFSNTDKLPDSQSHSQHCTMPPPLNRKMNGS